ncbi:transmembrane 220 family protein [Algoriphagus hitonicola]|uniref:Transmembrane family 220, helix n=1 Tax=Algoriphagus hitonicola TaxID=435880 RepID=A0A1I2WF27_9BACT|nr:transmembrane 220 family protein [Algoriphagus hitonicola]SFG99922.1 Transmembrane family 220, helix [Algoriphagus hitonicola]
MKFSKIFYSIWAVLFGLFAFWQINDPDPEVWVSIYVVAIIFCLLAIRGIFPKIPLTILVAVCLIGAIYFWPDSVSGWIGQEVEQGDLTMKTPEMEEGRESFGLLIIALVNIPGLIKAWRS